jgi:glutathione S-transferase
MTLYITKDCRTCSGIRASLEDTAIAHETVIVPQQERSDRLPEGTEPPVLVDDDRVIQGNREILVYIEELKQLRDDWLKYQSDVCYCD